MIFAAAGARAAEQTLQLPGLQAQVTVRYTAQGIPSIQAASLHDLAFAQGYVHAQDRLWQMDINRRRSTGRMAELFGKGSVGGDYQVHLAMLPEVAQQSWDECMPEECLMFQAYADGVNAYLAQMKEPPEEYQQIGATPAPWSPVDSLAIGRGLSWGMSTSIGLEIALGMIAKTMGVSAVMKLIPFDGVDTIAITDHESLSSFPADDFDERVAQKLDEPLFRSGWWGSNSPVGSNNWVVSGGRTDTGAPMLSNDTHMGLSLPCDWYEVHLESPELHVVGLSVPGSPGILVGHNEHVAWGVTQARFDVNDGYVEKLDPEQPDTHYIHKDESLPFEKQTVVIKYKTDDGGAAEEERTVLHTLHGPVVYEADRPRTVISMRWTGHVPTHESMAFMGFMTAKNVDDFKQALEYFEVGALNFVFADTEGNIFYRGQGKIPLRKGKPFLPLDGSSGKYEWQGYIPFDELPYLENPQAGFAVSANNRQAPRDFRYYLGALYDKGWRARRITDMILDANPMTFQGMQNMQTDVYSLPAEHFLPLLYSALEENPNAVTPDAVAALDILKNWDRRDIKESPAPSIFYTWIKFCTINTFKDNLPDEIFHQMARSEVVYPILLQNKKLPIDVFDDMSTPDVHETKPMIFARSFADAVADLKERYGDDPQQWTWDKMHKVKLGHQLGGEFNLGPAPGDGGTDSINVAGFGLIGNDFNYGAGPNMRMTVELAPDGPRGQNVIAGGQSGHRGDPNYDNQFHDWLNYKTHLMPFREEDVARDTVRTLILAPAK